MFSLRIMVAIMAFASLSLGLPKADLSPELSLHGASINTTVSTILAQSLELPHEVSQKVLWGANTYSENEPLPQNNLPQNPPKTIKKHKANCHIHSAGPATSASPAMTTPMAASPTLATSYVVAPYTFESQS